MATYKVDSIVCDYGVYEDGELKLICNSMRNALLIKDIMEKDNRYGSGLNGNPTYVAKDFNNFINQFEKDLMEEKI